MVLFVVLEQLPTFGVGFPKTVDEVLLCEREFLRGVGDVEILVMSNFNACTPLESVA